MINRERQRATTEQTFSKRRLWLRCRPKRVLLTEALLMKKNGNKRLNVSKRKLHFHLNSGEQPNEGEK